MRTSTVVQRTLEIDAAREPLSGRLIADGRPERRFRGWLELFAVVEEVRAAADTDKRSNERHLHG